MSDATHGTSKVAEDAGIVGGSLGPQGGEGRKGAGLAGEFTGVATDIAGAAVEQGRALLDAAAGQARGFADDRKDEAARSVSDIASSLRESGRSFEDRPSLQAFVGTAADGLDQLAEGLRQRSFADIYAEVEDFARARPLAVGAAAVAAGFMLARFVKSSGEDLAETRRAAARHGATRASADA